MIARVAVARAHAFHGAQRHVTCRTFSDIAIPEEANEAVEKLLGSCIRDLMALPAVEEAGGLGQRCKVVWARC